MIGLDNPALQQALQLAQQPELRLKLQKAPLPPGVSDLIRLISDDGGSRSTVAQAVQISSDALQQRLINYYLEVCLYPGSSPERMLALNPSAELRLAKEHHRLLIKWLHPDRNPDNATLAEQVNRAWSQLKAARSMPPPLHSENASTPASAEWQPRPVPAVKSRFPLFLAVLAVAGLALLLLATLPDAEIYSGMDERKANAAEAAPAALAGNETPELNALGTAAWPESTEANSTALPAPTEPAAPAQAVVTPVKTEKTPEASPASSLALPERVLSQTLPKVSPPAVKEAKLREEKPSAAVQQESMQDSIPVAKAPAPETMPTAPSPVSQAEAAALLQVFQQGYRQGNTQAFMGLFSNGARNNRGDRSAIEADYQRLFEASYFREVSLSKPQWQNSPDGLRATVRFVSRVQRESDRAPVKNKGTLALTFIRESGQARIHRIILSP